MKTGVHPSYHKDVKILCTCGHIVVAGSTKEEICTEVCSNCHPFYTGKQKLIDTAGRVDKFRAKMEKAKKIQGDKKGKKETGVVNEENIREEIREEKEVKKGKKSVDTKKEQEEPISQAQMEIPVDETGGKEGAENVEDPVEKG